MPALPSVAYAGASTRRRTSPVSTDFKFRTSFVFEEGRELKRQGRMMQPQSHRLVDLALGAVLSPGGAIFPLTVTRGTLAPTPAPDLEAVRIPGVTSRTDPNLETHPVTPAVPGPGARGAESRSRTRPDRGPGPTVSEDPPKR
ncbi:hypothetical protein MTO96_019581 [Rhipicephalus appendiculatus]